MHKSWGNSIDFDEAAERMGVDVMRWLYATARPEDNIRFGWHAADEARRRLLVLWNVYSFFVTYATLAGWTPRSATEAGSGVARAAAAPRPPLDRWILSRAAGLADLAGREIADFDLLEAMRAVDGFIEDLSTWYLRRSRDRMRAGAAAADREAAFATLHAALVVLARVIAPVLPFLAETMYQNLVVAVEPDPPDSVHLTHWPTAETATYRDEPLEASMSVAMRAVELVRTLRAQAGLRTRQPIARLWLALPGGDMTEREALLALVADEVNVKAIELIGDESDLVERRVKVLLPKVGKRLGSKIPDVMAAARDGRFEIHPDGSVTLAGVTVAADEVEVQASPKPGTAVAHDQGLVAVIDTRLTPELIAEGDARELQRAIQDLRKDAGLALDDRIEAWAEGLPAAVQGYLDSVAVETLADAIVAGPPPAADPTLVRSTLELAAGAVHIAIRRALGGRA
jgi:isoleucyl-tRNA synthetase